MSALPSLRDAVFAVFLQTLDSSGLRAALAYLLLNTEYRFIGILCFRSGMATTVVHYDRLHPEQLTTREIPQDNTYCYFVKESRGVFSTPNTLKDDRLAGHPARERVQSYCGVPILDAAGTLLGSLCCYDVVPRDSDQVDVGLLMRVANMLAQGNHIPSYPTAEGFAPGRQTPPPGLTAIP